MGTRHSAAWMRLASLPFIRNFSLNLGLLCILLSLNVFSCGYDISIYNSIQAMTPFARTFGTCNSVTNVCVISTTNLSLLNAIPLVGFAFGILGASLIGEAFGRRLIYVLVLIISIVGIGVSYSASTFGQILAGRILVNISVGMESWLVPMFQAEVVPAQVRGAIVTLYPLFRLVGALVVGCITFKTADYPDNSAWKIPLAIMFAVPSLCLCLSWYMPESPRWLLRKGKEEQALKIMNRLYGSHALYDAEMELVLLKASLEQEVEKGSWADLWRGDNARRTNIAIICSFFGQATGQAFANQYGVVFLKTLGTINAFQFNVISLSVGIVGTLIFMVLVDRLGRRFFYLTFAPIASISMIVVGSLGCATTLTPGMKTGIAAMFPVFATFYLGSFAPLQTLAAAEISSLKLRDKTAMVSWSVSNLTTFVASFTVPYLINPGYGNLGAKVAFVYGGIGLCGVIWAYFYFPELKQRSLEEIDEMLRESVPARKTRKWKANADSIGARVTNIEGNDTMPDDDNEKHVGVETEHIEK